MRAKPVEVGSGGTTPGRWPAVVMVIACGVWRERARRRGRWPADVSRDRRAGGDGTAQGMRPTEDRRYFVRNDREHSP